MFAKGNFFYKRLGKRVIQARIHRNLTQEELAWISELDRTYLARIEGGRANPTIKVLYRLSGKLNVKMHELLHGL